MGLIVRRLALFISSIILQKSFFFFFVYPNLRASAKSYIYNRRTFAVAPIVTKTNEK